MDLLAHLLDALIEVCYLRVECVRLQLFVLLFLINLVNFGSHALLFARKLLVWLELHVFVELHREFYQSLPKGTLELRALINLLDRHRVHDDVLLLGAELVVVVLVDRDFDVGLVHVLHYSLPDIAHLLVLSLRIVLWLLSDGNARKELDVVVEVVESAVCEDKEEHFDDVDVDLVGYWVVHKFLHLN